MEVDFNLHDNDDDGKVRINELIGNIYDEAVINEDPVFAPLAVFDISGSVFAQLSAFLEDRPLLLVVRAHLEHHAEDHAGRLRN